MNSLSGHLLIAPVIESDPDFIKTVIFIIQHSDQQALGVVLNRPSSRTVEDAWKGKLNWKSRQCIYSGGPVPGPLMAVHACQPLGEIEIMTGVYYSVRKKHIEQIAAGSDFLCKIFDGHAGWGPGQLEQWLEEKAFHALPATSECVFDIGDNLWEKALGQVQDR
ncbi:MAG: YqgE/AlgH family protein [Thermoguttaceae bacterium]|jgi:putative transcriptional regulator